MRTTQYTVKGKRIFAIRMDLGNELENHTNPRSGIEINVYRGFIRHELMEKNRWI